MSAAFPSDKMIRQSILRLAPELLHRYGRAKDCTRLQLAKTTEDLKTDQLVFPYLCASFMAEEDLRAFQAEQHDILWLEVQNRTARIITEISKHSPISDHFYESGLGESGDASIH
jgi:hypothetical protein